MLCTWLLQSDLALDLHAVCMCKCIWYKCESPRHCICSCSQSHLPFKSLATLFFPLSLSNCTGSKEMQAWVWLWLSNRATHIILTAEKEIRFFFFFCSNLRTVLLMYRLKFFDVYVFSDTCSLTLDAETFMCKVKKTLYTATYTYFHF